MSVNTTASMGMNKKSNADIESIADTAPSVSAQERRERVSRMGVMKGLFAEMERVSIRVPEDTRVQINGYVFKIKGKTRVSVPVLVSDVLEQSGRI